MWLLNSPKLNHRGTTSEEMSKGPSEALSDIAELKDMLQITVYLRLRQTAVKKKRSAVKRLSCIKLRTVGKSKLQVVHV